MQLSIVFYMFAGLLGFAFLYSYGKMRFSEARNYTPKYVSDQIELPPIKYRRSYDKMKTFLKIFALLWFASGGISAYILYNLIGIEKYYQTLTGPPWAHIRDLTYQEVADEHYYVMWGMATGFYLILVWLPMTFKMGKWLIEILFVKAGAEYLIDYAKK